MLIFDSVNSHSFNRLFKRDNNCCSKP